LDLEDRLWEQLEAAAGREAASGRMGRVAAAARAVLPAWRLRAGAVTLAATAATIALVLAVVPDRDEPQRHVVQFGVGGHRLTSGVVGHGALWSYDEQAGQVLRLDARTHRVSARVTLPPMSSTVSLATGDHAVWVVPTSPVSHSSGTRPELTPVDLTRIDPRTNSVVSTVPLPAALRPFDLVTLPGVVWVWGQGGAVQVDPASMRVSTLIAPRGERVLGFAATRRRVTFLTDFAQIVTVDARTGERLATVPLDGSVVGEELVPIGNDVVVYRQGGTLASIDPIRGHDRWTVHLGSQPRDLTMVGGRLWVLIAKPGARSSEVVVLDPGDGHLVERIALPVPDARKIAASGGTPVVTTQSGELIAVSPPGP
jgi:streptogramin lyase